MWFFNEIQFDEDFVDFVWMILDEYYVLIYFMSYFNFNELFVNKVLVFGVYFYVNVVECYLYLVKQMWEEVNYCMVFEYVFEIFLIDCDEVY